MTRTLLLGFAFCLFGLTPAIAQTPKDNGEKIYAALVGTWQGRWTAVRGQGAGSVKLVVHEAKWPNVLNSTIQFTGAGPFGTDPYVPSVRENGPAGDTFAFTGMRNGISFEMIVTIQANGIQLKPWVPYELPDLITASMISAEFVKQ